MSNVVLLMVLLLMWVLNTGFGLMAELLSFASPKESNQRKGEVAKAGFGLLADLLFFASPKKSKQKKGEPKAVPLRGSLRYSRRPGSCANSLRSNKRPP
jgi:hypothetical protein